jgi:hypothetical protein
MNVYFNQIISNLNQIEINLINLIIYYGEYFIIVDEFSTGILDFFL